MTQDGAVEDRGPMASSNDTCQPHRPNAISPHRQPAWAPSAIKGPVQCFWLYNCRVKTQAKIFVRVGKACSEDLGREKGDGESLFT